MILWAAENRALDSDDGGEVAIRLDLRTRRWQVATNMLAMANSFETQRQLHGQSNRHSRRRCLSPDRDLARTQWDH